jgi:hypothetical protein
MARISLKCECGWNFFVPGTAQGHEAPCPNCGGAVPIPGRSASGDGPKSPGQIAAEKQARQKQVVLLVSAAVAVVVVALLVVLMSGGKPAPIEEETTGKSFNLDKPRGPVKPPENKIKDYKTPTTFENPVADPRAPVGPNRESKINEHRNAIKGLVWRLNLAGVTAESLRLRGHADAQAQLLDRMKGWEGKIAENLAALAELGEKFAVEPHIRSGDRLVGFAQKDFQTLPGSRIDLEVLSPWLRKFQAGMPIEQAVVTRGSERLELYLQFPEAEEDLQTIARMPDISGEGRYVDGPVLPAGSGAIPPELLAEVETRFKAIPAGYKNLLPLNEAQKLDGLLRAKMAPPEDLQFLQVRILQEALPVFEREAQNVRAKTAELELKVKDSTAVDTVHCKDGRRLQGKVVSKTEESLKLKGQFGTVGIPMSDILKVEEGKGAGVEFPGKLAACPRTAPDLIKLYTWCRQNNLMVESQYVAALILGIDPTHEDSRRAHSLPARPAGGKPGGAAVAPAGTFTAASGTGDAWKAMDALAQSVVRNYPALGDVVAQMRAGSIGALAPASAQVPPPRSARAAQLIQDPLTFTPARLDAAAALEIGQWWGPLSVEDRREFATFFGLWCAQKRAGR